MGDILDYVSSQWPSLLGMGGSANASTSSPNLTSPPGGTASVANPTSGSGSSVGTTTSPAGSFSPSGVMDVNPLTGTPLTTLPAAQPFPSTGVSSPSFLDASLAAQSGMPPPETVSAAPRVAAAPWPAPPPPANLPDGTSGYGGGMTQPSPANPYITPGGLGGGPLARIPTSTGPVAPPTSSAALPVAPNGGGPNSNSIDATSYGLAAQPAPLNILPDSAQGPTPSTTGNFASALGLRQQPNDWQGAMTRGLAGLGRGLEQVGQLKPGVPGAQAFAAGMGGGLTGGINMMEQQQAQARQAQNDLFNKKSQAFKDWVALQDSDSRAAYYKAHGNYFNLAAQAKINGRDAFSNTPYAKARDIERMLDSEDDRMRKTIADKLAHGLIDGEEAKKEYKTIEDSRGQRREQRAANLGIDPDEHLSGVDQSHAFDFDRLTPAQRLQIPDGSYYKWKDPQTGETKYQTRDYLKMAPYAGWSPPSTPAASAALSPAEVSQSANYIQ